MTKVSACLQFNTWLTGTTARPLATEWVSVHWLGGEPWERGAVRTNQVPVASRAQLHTELIAFLRKRCPVADERHLVLLD